MNDPPKVVYYMNDATADLPAGSVLTIAGTDSMFAKEFHLFSLIVRKPGVQVGLGSSAGATVPDRYAVGNILLNISLFQTPNLKLSYVSLSNVIIIILSCQFVILVVLILLYSISCVLNCVTGINPTNNKSMIFMDPDASFKQVSTVLNYIPGQTYIYEYAMYSLSKNI